MFNDTGGGGVCPRVFRSREIIPQALFPGTLQASRHLRRLHLLAILEMKGTGILSYYVPVPGKSANPCQAGADHQEIGTNPQEPNADLHGADLHQSGADLHQLSADPHQVGAYPPKMIAEPQPRLQSLQTDRVASPPRGPHRRCPNTPCRIM